MKTRYLAILAAVALASSAAFGSDHRDGPRATARPSADLTDLYMWWNEDHSRLNLILNTHPNASKNGWADPEVAYVIHLAGQRERGRKAEGRADLACRFSDTSHVHCELGQVVVEGEVGPTLASAGQELQVAAGLRPDPAVWNRSGYEATIHAIHDGIFGGLIQLDYDGAGCPLLGPSVHQLIQDGLSHAADGEAAENAYDGQRIVSLQLSIARDQLPAGKLLSAWAASYEWQVQP